MATVFCHSERSEESAPSLFAYCLTENQKRFLAVSAMVQGRVVLVLILTRNEKRETRTYYPATAFFASALVLA